MPPLNPLKKPAYTAVYGTRKKKCNIFPLPKFSITVHVCIQSFLTVECMCISTHFYNYIHARVYIYSTSPNGKLQYAVFHVVANVMSGNAGVHTHPRLPLVQQAVPVECMFLFSCAVLVYKGHSSNAPNHTVATLKEDTLSIMD